VIKVDQRVCITRQDHYYSTTLDYRKFEAFCHLVLRELAVTLLAYKSLCRHQHHFYYAYAGHDKIHAIKAYGKSTV